MNNYFGDWTDVVWFLVGLSVFYWCFKGLERHWSAENKTNRRLFLEEGRKN